jgi:hypothetical protein
VEKIKPMDVAESKRISPLMWLVAGILLVCTLFLLIPSSKNVRTKKAVDAFNKKYVPRPSEFVEPLLQAELATSNGLISVGTKEQFAVFVFVPKPGNSKVATSSAAMMNEIIYRPSYFQANGGSIKTGILFAPDPASTGWTLFAKVWLARCIEKKLVGDIKNYGLRLVNSGTATTAELNTLWLAVPVDVQRKVEAMLERNREIGKKMGSTLRIFHSSDGTTYDLPSKSTLSDFLWSYYVAYPEAVPSNASRP